MTAQVISAEQINAKLHTLNASTTFNAYSGLTAEDVTDGVVRIFDDYDGGEYDAANALAALSECSRILWDEYENTENAFDEIWQALGNAEV